MKIITNNQWRSMKYGYEMPEKFRADFDYINPENFNLHDFFTYHGQWYDLDWFMRIENCPDFADWHGYYGDSAFSGVLVKVSLDGERVKIGRYFS